ncbi:MAG: M28 family peptidase [Akkermansia sp.]|nr:M28 family peptidase [Akkermansia sp.]
MKRALKPILLLLPVLALLLVSGCTMLSLKEAPADAPAPPPALAAELRRGVETLCAHPRYGATLSRAQEYIAAELAAAGYAVRYQEFTNAEGTFRNIIAERTGTQPGRYVVGAHYDACEPADPQDSNPGADDNASAVAALLALARRLPAHPRHTVELVFYACEEPPWFGTEGMGSHAHAQLCNPQDTLGMVCLEMLGCFSDAPGSQPALFPGHSLLLPTQGNFIAVVGNLDSVSLGRSAQRHLRRHIRTLRVNVPFAGDTPLYFSDHRNYAPRGIPSIMVTDTAMLRNHRYHERQDTPDTLDYTRMAAVTQGVLSLVRELAY